MYLLFITTISATLRSNTDSPRSKVALLLCVLGVPDCLPIIHLWCHSIYCTVQYIRFVFACSVDELLDGGVWTGEVTEIVGSVGAGKTQVLYSR